MNESQTGFQEVFDELYKIAIPDKIKYLEALLFYFTLTSRGIWSDDKSSDSEKVVAFKWLNELSHRIWNIRFDLQQGEDNESVTRLYENIRFYSEQSDLLRMHLLPTTIGGFENFKVGR